MDLFGIGARARVKALEEALEAERARTAELTKQVMAMADSKAYRATLPRAERIQRMNMVEKPGITLPSQIQNSANVISRARDILRNTVPVKGDS